MKYLYLMLGLTLGSCLTSDAQGIHYENLIQKLVADFETPGVAVGIFNNDVFNEYFNGYSNIELEKEIDRNTQFNVASISKVVTAIAIMQLVERGKVALDQPINNYLTSWKIKSDKFNTDKVTVRRILNHTAGLSREFGPGFNSQDSLVSLVDIFTGNSEKREPLSIVYDPGSSSLYSNMGYGLLQLLIEDISGTTFNEYISKNVFEPLGMSQSTFQDHIARLWL